MEIIRYWEIICRRKWIVIITFFAFFAAVAIATNIATPVYEAKAKIHIETSDTLSSLMSTLGLTEQGRTASSTTEANYDTDIALVTMSPVLEKLISTLNLKDRDGEKIKPEKLAKSSILNTILPQPNIEIEQYEESDILEIISKSADPSEAANMSNKLAELYIDDRLENLRKEYSVARIFLEDRITDVKNKYSNSLSEKKDFMVKEGFADLQTESKNIITYLSDMKKEYNENEIAIAQASENIEIIEAKIGGKGYASSDWVNTLEKKLNDLMVDISGKQVELTAEHQDVLQLNKQIDTIEAILKDRAEVVFNNKKVSVAPVHDELIKNLKDAYINKKIGEAKRDLLTIYISKTQNEMIDLPIKNMKQSEIDLSLSVNQDIYKTLLEQLTQIGIAESMTLSNIKLVEPAAIPDLKKPDFPNAPLNYILGILFGLFLGVLGAFFMDYIDNTIKNSGDLKNYRFTFLGDVPKFKKAGLVSETDPNDPVYESYRKINANINFAKLDNPPKKILISSINPKEGSSSTAANLGIVLANEGKKVLLLDADLRRPNIHNLFGLQNTGGLTSLLTDKIEIKNAVHETGIKGLEVLTSGTIPADPVALIKSKKMQDTISKLEENYDVILFDSAPLLIKNDAVSMMSFMDGLVLISRSGQTTHNAVLKVESILENAKIAPIGIILNCI